MKYPKYIQKNDAIGICAPSDGVTDLLKQIRLDNAIKKFQKKGYQIIEANHVRTSKNGKSAPCKIQAKELETLFKNSKVTSIICAAGGDFLLEVLPEIKWNILKENPKWIQGYSDISSLLYILTTKYDIATIYADNIGNFGMNPWHISLENNQKILEGKKVIQKNFLYYEKNAIERVTGLEPYHLDSKVKYKIINGPKDMTLTGRIIGGCLDCLISLCGTKFDSTKTFLEKYKEDGFVWYFDNAELTMENLTRALWQLEQCGWFMYVKGFLFGRCIEEKSFYEISEKEAILNVLKKYDVPIVTKMDFGHVSPRITIINGSYVKLQMKKNQMKWEMWTKE